jgi:hypothetical protein
MHEDDPSHASNYPGKVFAASDSHIFRKQKNYANPLYMGTDLAALARVQLRIDELQEAAELPNSYDMHNPVQLLPDRVFDTTNRSTVVGAQKFAFDPDGFKQGRPLQRTLFYLDPFVTCQWCNMVTFVDVMSIRRSLAMPDDLSKSLNLPLESLPPCRKCGKAEYLEVGSHDFSELIANRDKVAKEKARRELAAAILIQRNYRVYLRKAYARAAAAARLALAKLQAKAATRINACVRYFLANRRIVAERHLRVIKTCHAVLLVHALKQPKKHDRRYNFKAKTFWFERKVELDLVFRHYISLAERLGWNPTRKQMEMNFAELSNRIVARQSDLLSLIQRAWRGFMARRIVMYYRTEVIRLRQFLLSKAFKIQRLWRGHRVRLLVPTLRHRRAQDKTREAYADYKEKQRLANERSDSRIMTKNAYIKERAEERTARYTQRIDLATDHQNRKMRAFAASCYSDNRLQVQMDHLMGTEMHQVALRKEETEAAHARKEFLLKRIAETGPLGYGSRSEMPDASTVKIVNGFHMGEERIPPRSKSMKKLLQAEVQDIMQGVIERATHNFVIPRLNERLKEYNAERPVGRQESGFKPKKITQPRLGGLVENPSSSAGAGSGAGINRSNSRGGSRGEDVGNKKSAKLQAAAAAAAAAKKKRQEEDDDLGGTGSAFDTTLDGGGGDDGDDDDDDGGERLRQAVRGAGGGSRQSSPSPPSRGGGSPLTAGAGGRRQAFAVTSAGSAGIGRFRNAGMGSPTGGWARGKTKGTTRKFKDYKFPDNVNADPMAFLNEDMDLILAFTDQRAKERQAAAVQSDLQSVQLRPKERKKFEGTF